MSSEINAVSDIEADCRRLYAENDRLRAELREFQQMGYGDGKKLAQRNAALLSALVNLMDAHENLARCKEEYEGSRETNDKQDLSQACANLSYVEDAARQAIAEAGE